MPTEELNETSEELNETSEESNETSEESFRPSVENKKYPRGELRIPTWIFCFIVSVD